MSKYFGDIVEDAIIKLPWNTFNSDGASVTVTAVSTDIEVFKDGVILTDPDAGGTVTLNVGTGNGSHFVTIDTSADAEYTTGSDYEAKLAGITVDSQTVNAFIGSFSIQNRYMVGTDGANTTVPDAAGTAPTAIENRQEMDSNSAQLAKIGTIPALDGAAQTIGAAIAKIADDNGGADFDATTDSLEKISGSISSGGGTPDLR
jgi:hypothetical protein